MVKGVIENTKEKKPLVHLIQNYVTANDCANLCLSVGAHPIMADSACEVEEITSCADALVLNMGTLNEQKLESMLIAGKAANKKRIPVILDPVGVGASRFRYDSVLNLLQQVDFSVIRGNYSEIQMIAYAKSNAVGVDAGNEFYDDTELEIATAKEVALRYKCIVVVTGNTDIIVDDEHVIICNNGHKLMKKVTGTGCMMTSLIACYLAANDNMIDAVITAVCVMGISGEKAFVRMKEYDGMASYKRYLLDAVGNMDEKIVLEDMKIKTEKSDYKLYAITQRIEGRDIAREVEKAIKGGATFIQLREKNISQEEYVELAKRVKKVTDKYGIPLVINDDIEVMKKADADGVHLGQSDLVGNVRDVVGKDKILGITAKTVEQAKKAQQVGADYIGSGAVFSTSTKKDAIPLDHYILQEICKSIEIPVVAIGGITRENIMELMGRDISGVAVVSGLFGAKDVEAEAKILRESVEEILK